MSNREIIDFVENQILQSLDGASVEGIKFDFKLEWYDLKSEEGTNEFLKDSTAMLNSYGNHDGLIVIGFDAKRKIFQDALLSQSNLRDESDIVGLIRRRVDRPFHCHVFDATFKGDDGTLHSISIIHLPTSLERPHIIQVYKKNNTDFLREIFIRKGGSTERPTKHDFDLMYADNKKEQPEVRLVFHILGMVFHKDYSTNNLLCHGSCQIENLGFRPALLKNLTMTIVTNISDQYPKLDFELHWHSQENKIHVPKSEMIQQGLYLTSKIKFDDDTINQFVADDSKSLRKNMRIQNVNALLSTGESIECEFNI